MGNIFPIRRGEEPSLALSNGGTDVFFDVMALASCALAESPWQQHLALHFADGYRYGLGLLGFALTELPWTVDARAERLFVLQVIDLALARHGWELLTYDPPYAIQYLQQYRAMVESFDPTPNAESRFGDWRNPPEPDFLRRCPTHHLFMGLYGCRLCDPLLQCQ